MICGVCKERDVTIQHVRDHEVEILHEMLGGMNAPVVLKPAPVRLPITEEGVYFEPGSAVRASAYYSVYRSESSGHLYAKVWNVATERWAYAPGVLRYLTADQRVTAEQAKQFGDLYSRCVFCARKLTNTDPGCSVDRGYGETCADNNNLPWGLHD